MSDHLDELQQRLYTRDPDHMPTRKFGILHPVKQDTVSTWGTTKLPEEKVLHPKSAKGYKRFFTIALVFFLAALGAAAFSLYRGAVTLSSKNVELTILGSSFVGGGEELPIQVEIANKNAADLVGVRLTLNYPKGATDESGSDVVRIERELGTIASGKTKSEEFIAILYGEQGISRTVTATLTYELEGSSAQFQKESTFSVMVSSSPVGLTVDAPTAVVSNQSFTLTLHNTFGGDKQLGNVVTRVEYPDGFVFQSANPKPTAGTNVWNLGDLQVGDERTIVITGKLIGEVGDEKAFRTYVGVPENEMSNKIAVAYNSALSTLSISEPFISAGLTIGNSREDIVALTVGDDVSGKVTWVNNSGLTVTNPVFTLSLDGTSVDTSTITAPRSFYNQLERTVTWTQDSDPLIVSIAPGASGEFPFAFKTIPPSTGSRDIILSLSVAGMFPERNNAEQEINTIDQKIIRFGSNIQFSAQSLYSIGAITNSGPYPPAADKDTTYTVMWTVLPSENALMGVKATAVLPAGVNWTGVVVPSTEGISYNSENKTVTWNVGVLPKATSIPKSKSVSFQIKVRPTKSQIGSAVDLLGPTTITATDSVTQTSVTAIKGGLTTKFETDPVYTIGADRVVP